MSLVIRPVRGVNKEASLFRDIIFGANDGVVTTFAVIAGSLGGNLSVEIVMILGFANLFADGFSMASGIYLGAKSEADMEKRMRNPHWREDVPLIQAIVTFLAFACGGFVPLIPFIFGLENKILISVVLMFSFLFVVGSLRSRFTGKNFLVSGLEMLLVGGLAAGIAFLVGRFIDGILV